MKCNKYKSTSKVITMEKVLVLSKNVSETDYYEKNIYAGTLAGLPIYFFDIV